MSNILIDNNFYIGTSSACIIDLTPPTFAGITGLDVESRGQIRASWSAASDATAPIRYEVYIKASTATGLFNVANIIAVSPNLQYDIFTLPDGSFLANGTTYYVGVRAIDGVNNRDNNTVSQSVISTGVLTAIDVYETFGAFVVNTSNQFQGTIWANKNDSLAISPGATMGTAAYQVYDKTGSAIVGMSQSGITINGQGQYIITPVSNLLTEAFEHYVVKVTVTVDSEARVNYVALVDERPDYKANGLFFVDSANDFDGTFWISRNEVLKTTGLGAGAYEVFDHDGLPVVGMSQSGITADSNGIYKITHLASLLDENSPGYSVKLTIVVDGVTRTQMIPIVIAPYSYEVKGQFSINALNQLQATFWVAYDSSVEIAGLGTASYQIYDANGVTVSGLNESGLIADGNGRFKITPVSATLLTDLTHYSAKITVDVNGIDRIAYKGFSLLGN
jgi:hypothetical protein